MYSYQTISEEYGGGGSSAAITVPYDGGGSDGPEAKAVTVSYEGGGSDGPEGTSTLAWPTVALG